MADDRPSDTDPSESDVNSEEGGQDVSEETSSEESVVQEFEEIAGREFKDFDDVKKHYENLKEFSGTEEAQELREKAQKFEELQEKADGLLGDMSEEDKEEIEEKEKEGRLDKLEEKFHKSEFLRDYPDAGEHMELVEAVADKKDVSYEKAWNGYVEDYGVSKSEKEKEKSDSTKSKPRVAPEKREKINQLAKQASDSDEAAEELVSELGLTE